MTVKEAFESIRESERNKIDIQFRDENNNYICDTYVHALGMRPYLDCEVKEWEPFVSKKEHGLTITIGENVCIVAQIYLETAEQVIAKTEDVIKEAEAVIKESKDVIKQSSTAAGQKGFTQAPKKEKICELCGKPFHPNSGVQKYCNDCKKLRDDIKKTAQELLEG